jgi:hypothetical protein
MADPLDPRRGPDADSLLLVVVGAHLIAELEDRPLADELRDRIDSWLDDADPEEVVLPVVCTDLWYLNAPDLRRRPTISVGGPGVNAVTAYLARRLPTAMVIDDTLRLHLDLEYLQPQCAMWGTTFEGTASAVDLFCTRYQDRFLRSALRLPV